MNLFPTPPTVFVTLALLAGCQPSPLSAAPEPFDNCKVSFTILGTGQDGGAPQIGNHDDPAWSDETLKLMAASGALVNHETGAYYLLEATPDIREQLFLLSDMFKMRENIPPLNLSGVAITHAHIGHYTGLMMFGHEAAGLKDLPVYAMPRMASYLENNGPWSQLVEFQNIKLKRLQNAQPSELEDTISITPYQVPHRDEFSETVGFVIQTAQSSLLFLPDIDSWDEWEEEFDLSIEEMIDSVDYAYLDATFYDDNELPGRDMSLIPHPRMLDSAKRFSKMSDLNKSKIRFFHMNHTNPARYPNSEHARQIKTLGFHIAKQGESLCLETRLKP